MTDAEHRAEPTGAVSGTDATTAGGDPTAEGPPPPDPAAAPAPDYDNAGVPTLDYVRDKIEGRYATAVGTTELADEIPEVRRLAEQQAERDKAAQERLEEIRRSLRES